MAGDLACFPVRAGRPRGLIMVPARIKLAADGDCRQLSPAGFLRPLLPLAFLCPQ
jgi:hypothetical protein